MADLSGEVAAFAGAFPELPAARRVLESVGFSVGDLPAWAVSTAAEFWGEVFRLLANGAVVGDRGRLYAAALEQFPDSEVFAAGARTSTGRARVPASWDVVRAGWPFPDPFVDRTVAVGAVRDLLTVNGAGPVGVVGMGGAGKSTVARAVLHDGEVRGRFVDGAVWVEVNPGGDVAAVQGRVLAAFGDPRPVADVAEGRDRLRGLLAGAACLIVLDDVWEPAVVDGFPRLAGVRLLVTSRSSHVLPVTTPICPVGLVDDSTARQLLAAYARQPVPELSTARGVLDRCGGLAVALAIAGGLVRELWDWEEIAEAFDRADLVELTARFPDYPYPHLLGVIDAGTQLLPDGAAARLAELAVFKGHGPVPVSVVLDLWAATGPLDGRTARSVLRQLDGASLVRLHSDSRTVTAHDLVFDYARGSLPPGRFAELHGLIAHRFLDRWGSLNKALPLLAAAGRRDAADRYGLAWLVPHLLAADDADTVDAILAAERRTRGGQTESVWYAAHEGQGTTADYVTAIQAARDHTGTRSPAEPPTILARHVGYALILGSITTLAANIPLALLLRLVDTGVWPLGRALAYAQAIPDPTPRAEALTSLAPHLPAEQRAPILGQALTAATAIIRPDARA
ncbi:NB-ARC domain-containing protein, partial [Pseudofrankia sp. BMG5.36]|uniref:NB-ARC domain-containing protein n=1 Tax=Pseudofrankia sp. BMG5.36 TaxID=1834512 RepID=UPI000A3FF4A3